MNMNDCETYWESVSQCSTYWGQSPDTCDFSAVPDHTPWFIFSRMLYYVSNDVEKLHVYFLVSQEWILNILPPVNQKPQHENRSLYVRHLVISWWVQYLQLTLLVTYSCTMMLSLHLTYTKYQEQWVATMQCLGTNSSSMLVPWSNCQENYLCNMYNIPHI